jgi:MFS family permease
MAAQAREYGFYGWRVVEAAFLVGVFGWGIGFYGPPIFLSVTLQASGWHLALVSAAVSAHFLVGAITGAGLPSLHRHFGMAGVTKVGALSMATGTIGWAMAPSPWHLFLAAALSGAGWGMLSAAALNAMVAPWFVRTRPAALAMAYNGGSLGGVIFSPLWAAAIAALGFPAAACTLSALLVLAMWIMADRVFSRTPETMGLRPDGDAPDALPISVTSPAARALPGSQLWRDRKFLTLAAAMALGLFAQIGLTAHLFSLLEPALGAQHAGFAMALVTVMAIAGRTLLGWLMPLGADRRLLACVGYVAQLAGSFAFVLAAGMSAPLLIVGIVLFGAGFGNATSLPPLIAQVEFVKEDVQRVTSLIVAIAQGGYAFAPAFFGLIREFTLHVKEIAPGEAPVLFLVAASVQALAVTALLLGRQRAGLVSRASLR